MGAHYNTFLVPDSNRETIVAAVADALRLLGLRVDFCQANAEDEEDLEGCSGLTIFIGPSKKARWVTLSTWGFWMWPPDHPEIWNGRNPFGKCLSRSISPVVYYFSANAGYAAGYSIFSAGEQIEAQSLSWDPKFPDDPTCWPQILRNDRSVLAELIGEPNFDYVAFMRGFRWLEVGTAALAAKFGVSPHLIEPLDIEDGDGAIDVFDDDYTIVRLPGWFCVCYDKAKPDESKNSTKLGMIWQPRQVDQLE